LAAAPLPPSFAGSKLDSNMSPKYPTEAVIVSTDALESDDPYDLISSNIDVVNALLAEHLTHDEISTDALRSYYVDYFLAQLNNGGFSQFVYNSRWGECIDYITDGFAAMGANKHLEFFEDAAQKMSERPGIEGLKTFFGSEYFGENPERDILNEFNDGFFALEDVENLTELNAKWLRGHPNLVVLSRDEIAEEIQRRAEAIPDRDARIAAALADEPRYMKLIRRLCDEAAQTLDRVTAGDPSNEYGGQRVMAWHFVTDHGHHHMVDVNGTAIMFKGHSDEVVCQVEAGPEYGAE
jgi:hypothetical protein